MTVGGMGFIPERLLMMMMMMNGFLMGCLEVGARVSADNHAKEKPFIVFILFLHFYTVLLLCRAPPSYPITGLLMDIPSVKN